MYLLFTLFNIYKRNKPIKLSKNSYIHLCGPDENNKLKFLYSLKEKHII